MKGFVYILLRSDGKYYIWSTKSLSDRIQKHQNGWVQSTKWFRPLMLVWYKEFATYHDALTMENKLKKSKNKTFVQTFIGS